MYVFLFVTDWLVLYRNDYHSTTGDNTIEKKKVTFLAPMHITWGDACGKVITCVVFVVCVYDIYA